MSTREELLASIAETIKDYRAGERPQPTPEHVDRWVKQFDAAVQLPMLTELDHVFKQTYFSKDHVSNFFAHQIKQAKLVGSNPAAFWQTVNFLNIQRNGNSQKEILALFGTSLVQQCNVNISTCGVSGGPFFYLDDVLFSGTRISFDLCSWIEKTAPQNANVNILVIATYTLGEWMLMRRLDECAKKHNKQITFTCWAAHRLQNTKSLSVNKDNPAKHDQRACQLQQTLETQGCFLEPNQ